MTGNYQTIQVEANIPGYRQGDVEVVDLSHSYWTSHLQAGNVSLIEDRDVVPAPAPLKSVPDPEPDPVTEPDPELAYEDDGNAADLKVYDYAENFDEEADE